MPNYDEPAEDEDRPLPEDEAIEASHPMKTGRHDLYAEAMRLVGAKHTKGGLVDLVCWLLHRVTQGEADLQNAKANVRDIQAQIPTIQTARERWLTTPLGTLGRRTIQVEQVEELRALACRAFHIPFEPGGLGTAAPLPEEKCPQCGERDCGGAPRFQGTTLEKRLKMRAEEAEHRGCVQGGGPTVLYLRDGTKVHVKRDPDTVGRAWLEHVNTEVLTLAEPKTETPEEREMRVKCEKAFGKPRHEYSEAEFQRSRAQVEEALAQVRARSQTPHKCRGIAEIQGILDKWSADDLDDEDTIKAISNAAKCAQDEQATAAVPDEWVANYNRLEAARDCLKRQKALMQHYAEKALASEAPVDRTHYLLQIAEVDCDEQHGAKA